MPCLNVDLDYFSHRKVVRLCARLGVGAEIIPLKLWAYTGKFHPANGILAGYTDSELMLLSGISVPESSNATSILQALIDCEFVEKIKGGFAVKGWLEHQGHIATYHIRGKNAAANRWAKYRQNKHNNATSIPQALLKREQSIASSYAPIDLQAPKGVLDALEAIKDFEGSLVPLELDLSDQDQAKTGPNISSLQEILTRSKKREDPPTPQPIVAKVKKERKVFVIPTIEEITEYITERNSPINPKVFRDHYEANGWMRGRNAVSDWKACVRTWENQEEEKNKRQPPPVYRGSLI